MIDSKTNGQETDKSTFDRNTEEKLNSLDKLLKLRNTPPQDDSNKPKEDDDLDEEVGGLPGYGGIF